MIYPYLNPISGRTENWTVTYTISHYDGHKHPPGGEIENLHVYGESGVEITSELPQELIEDIEDACYDDPD